MTRRLGSLFVDAPGSLAQTALLDEMNIDASNFHDAILSSARITEGGELSLAFEGCRSSDPASARLVDVTLTAKSVRTVAVLSGPADKEPHRGILQSRDFEEWRRAL